MTTGPVIRKKVHHPIAVGLPRMLTFSCFKRKPFLKSERTCLFLVDAIRHSQQKHGYHLWAYVFMPEHVHMLIWQADDVSPVSAVLHSIKQSVARKALIYLRHHNPAGLTILATGQKHTPYRFWLDGGGYDQVLETDCSVKNAVMYIHDNPVRRGLCLHAEEWQWSSAQEWTGTGGGPLSIDREFFPVL